MSNKRFYERLKQPPKHALKQINGGRMNGKTDINPQWRYEAMTEVFGPVGFGWYYEIVKMWLEPYNEQIAAFVQINLYIKDGEEWSKPIPGTGGSMFVAKEKAGPFVSDEAYKMATTDALSVALKMVGVAGDIYAGMFDGSKYKDEAKETKQPQSAAPSIEYPSFVEYLGREGEYPILHGEYKGKTVKDLSDKELKKGKESEKLKATYPDLHAAISHICPPF